MWTNRHITVRKMLSQFVSFINDPDKSQPLFDFYLYKNDLSNLFRVLCYRMLKNCHKIGEGVYGEVFLFRNQEGSTSVMKIIPIEGVQMVNGEKQKKFEEILSEIVIAE